MPGVARVRVAPAFHLTHEMTQPPPDRLDSAPSKGLHVNPNYPPPRRVREYPPVVPGLNPGSLDALTAEQVISRQRAAAERTAAALAEPEPAESVSPAREDRPATRAPAKRDKPSGERSAKRQVAVEPPKPAERWRDGDLRIALPPGVSVSSGKPRRQSGPIRIPLDRLRRNEK